MKREEVKKHIEGITDEQLDWLMSEQGKDLEDYKTQVASLTDENKTLSTQLEDVQTKLQAFDGVELDDVKQLGALKDSVSNLTKELKETKDQYAFDTALNTAIQKANAKDIDLVRAKLDIEGLKKSKDQTKDIESAIAKCVENYDFLFKESSSSMNVELGGEQGKGGNADGLDGVTKAFQELNPNLKI